MAPRTLSRLLLLAFLGLLLVACGRARRPLASDNPLEGIQIDPSGYAIKGRMYLTIKAPRWDVSGTTSTTMVAHRPDDFFLQVRGPVNNVMVQGTANADELVVVIPPMNKVLVGATPDAAMKALTGGALGVDGLLSLLMARLPTEGLEVLETIPGDKSTLVRLGASGGYQALATIERKRGRLERIELRDADDKLLMWVSYNGWWRDARAFYPEILELEVPALELYVKADFQAWEVMGGVPDIFTTPKPAGGEVVDIEQALRQGIGGQQAAAEPVETEPVEAEPVETEPASSDQPPASDEHPEP